MKILQIASLGLPVRPDLKYGGTERVISYLDDIYTELGHDSMVAAPADSKVRGILLETIPESLWSMRGIVSVTREIRKNEDMTNEHYKKCLDFMLEDGRIDVIHDHPGAGIITRQEFEKSMSRIKAPVLQTLHGAYVPKHDYIYDKWRELSRKNRKISFNAISKSQRREFEQAGLEIRDVIYHGIPTDKFVPNGSKDDYLFSIGRISPEKGQHLAIEVAKRTGRPLIIAGEVHSVNNDYWREMVEPHVDGAQISFVGSLTDEEKIPYYQNAAAFIFPLQWKEPFGLVMIEAMACGTPVIAYERGSVPEIVKYGETGFVIKETGNREADLEAMVQAVNNLDSISPEACRRHAEQNFSIQGEAESYLKLYRKLIDSN